MPSLPRLVISAVRGGLGKTTIALGIIAAWRRTGRRITPFKKGPDFIDAGWLGAASGGLCYNLDLFLMDESTVLRSFQRHTAGKDGAVIEGNRGLYDGMDEAGTYSTARLAKVVNAPTVVILDCTKSTATVAAVALGCRQFDPDVPLRGFILNNIATARHEAVIRKAIERATGLPVMGALPRLGQDRFPERHMGLTPFQEHPDVDRAIAQTADVAERYLDLPGLWSLAQEAEQMPAAPDVPGPARAATSPVIGVIRDKAFQFYYPDNIEALEERGAKLREINALTDTALPEDLDSLYIGGGFPETQAAELAANESFCRSLRAAADRGLPIYAECGGLIYLGRSLTVGDRTYPMAGVLPAEFVLEKKPQAHGYTIVESREENAFFVPGFTAKGHEFHYSRIVNINELPPRSFRMQRGSGIDGGMDGIGRRKVLALYTHLHAAATPEWASAMVDSAAEYARSRTAAR